LCGVFLLGRLAGAQEISTSGSDRFRYGVEVAANFAPDDPGYFNDTGYKRSGLRLFRMSLTLELETAEWLSLLAEIRTDNLDVPEPYALYARVQPFRERSFTVQVGRVPPVFGAFARRRYDYDNPLIGYPLVYQYRTPVRADAAPQTVDQLLRRRGLGARTAYPIGSSTVKAGLPLLNPLRWDTGIQVHVGRDRLQFGAAVTQGTNASPRVRDDNTGKQIAARLMFRPTFGWTLGLSGARGDYVSDEVREDIVAPARPGHRYQTSWGVDTEFARGYWLLRAEGIWSRFESPTLDEGPLDTYGITVEARYKVFPGLYVAGRFDRLDFAEIPAPDGPITWDAPVNRYEVGLGYDVVRHLRVKFSVQWNERDGGPVTSDVLPAVQALVWF
jgi:hypothetical protein